MINEMDKSTQISLFFLTNLIFTFGSIIGFILWANNTNVVNYSYYSFCSVINLIFVIVGFCLYDKLEDEDEENETIQERHCWNGNIFICISFCYTVLWIFAALTSSLAIQQCLTSESNCSGVIMSTIFGYLLFIIWSLSFFITIIYR